MSTSSSVNLSLSGYFVVGGRAGNGRKFAGEGALGSQTLRVRANLHVERCQYSHKLTANEKDGYMF